MDLLTTSVATVESDSEPYTLVELTGEADVTNSDALREVLDAEVAKQPRTLIIDLSGLRFMDSSALHVVLRANRAMDRQGGVLALAGPREPVAKMLRLTAADQLIPGVPQRARGHRGIASPNPAGPCLPRFRLGYSPTQWCLRRRHVPRQSSACVLARPTIFLPDPQPPEGTP